jgi:hypothetical protein
LTGWHVDIEPEVSQAMGFEEKVAQAVDAIAAIPGLTREQADILVHRGFLSLEDLLQAEYTDLAEIPEIGDAAAGVIEAVRTEAARKSSGQ